MDSRARLTLLAVLAVSAIAGASCTPGESAPTAAPAVGAVSKQTFAAHYVDSAPAHGSTFALVPDRVLINFDFSLATPSTIEVIKDGSAIQIGEPTISGRNSLSLSSTLPSDSGDGLYVVTYKACWPDRSCHDGQFSFTVDRRTKSAYVDMTGKSEVLVDMKEFGFQPARIVVSRGTKVTWVNREAPVHFVNSDPHPSHNSVSGLNSLALKEGETYSYTFDQVGEWAIHCSAHVSQSMAGRVIVQ